MNIFITDLCFLLLNFKMSVTINNWSFIWKRKRLFASKSQNDATLIQIYKTQKTTQFPTDLVTFNEEIFNGKFHILSSDIENPNLRVFNL